MSFSVAEDAWLAEVMRRRVYRVDGGGDASGVLRGPGFYFAKLATDRVADVRALERVGLGVVDTNVTFELAREPDGDGAGVAELAAGEADAVLDIAATAFRYSRFHLDPQVGAPLANEIKREWIRNYVLGKRGAGLLVAHDRGRPSGFLAHLVANGTAVIDLIAVASDAQGRGIGGALVAAFARRYRGMPRVVGTQVANVPSIRLYTRHGFQLARSQYVLHAHES